MSSAFLMLVAGVIVKVIGAVYKIPLTAFIGGVGRGYFTTAYNLCMPIHAITMGAFPIAMSRLVSRYNAAGDGTRVSALKSGGSRVFFAVGIVGMCVMLLAADPYSRIIASSPDSMLTILVLAPSILFSAMAASYRGYYEGFMNMVPTAVSQTLEALFKMIFGLMFARMTMSHLYAEYSSSGTVMGTPAAGDVAALSIIYPYSSAAAMLGVTLGTFVSLVFVFFYHCINGDGGHRISRADRRDAAGELVSASLPIMLSSAVQSVFQFLDTASAQYALTGTDTSILSTAYAHCLSAASIADRDIATYVYGLLGVALDFKNLIPGITMALGVCAVPAISGAMQMGDKHRLQSLINSIYKYTMLIALLGGILLAEFAQQILQLFYGRTAMDIVYGCSDITRLFGYTACLYSVAGVAVFSVQAVGRAERSIIPYAVAGVVRVALNLLLIPRPDLILKGSVISGAVGYFIIAVWNIVIVCRTTGTGFFVTDAAVKPLLASGATMLLWQQISRVLVPGASVISLAVQGVLFCTIYCGLCLLFGVIDIDELRSLLPTKRCSRHLQSGVKYSKIN